MSCRPPTAAELVASVIYFDAYVHFEGDAVAFWKTLTPAQQDHADHLVRLVAHTGRRRTEPLTVALEGVALRLEYQARSYPRGSVGEAIALDDAKTCRQAIEAISSRPEIAPRV